MSVYFVGDTHLGHNNIAKYRRFVTSKLHNTQLICQDWAKTIKKKDVVFCLGDMAFDKESLDLIGNLQGRKILIGGNHDDFVSTQDKSAVFEEIHGMLKYKGLWLTHCPIHPAEMRKRKGNVHGHCHDFQITKGWGPFKKLHPMYLNCCVDVAWPKFGSIFTSLDQVREYFG